jgi:hypothetical protein
MVATVLLKRFEASFIQSALDKSVDSLHSAETDKERLLMKVHNMSRSRKVNLTDTETAALCEILLEVETFEEPRSEAEVTLAREILDRIELPGDWGDPVEFAKVVTTMPERRETKTVERPENLFSESGRSPPERKYHTLD